MRRRGAWTAAGVQRIAPGLRAVDAAWAGSRAAARRDVPLAGRPYRPRAGPSWPARFRPPHLAALQAAQWFPISSLPALAFDHKLVVRTAFRHLAAQEGGGELAEQLTAAADALEGPWQEA